MSYLVFARKYRPLKFDDIVGQEPVTKTLKNAVKLNKIAHAYLFSGPRGVGKTSAARLFAKVLNCLKGPVTEPCGECQNCVEITRGSALDTIEIDGASNRGIEDIRSLRDNVKFTPATSKYKVYIIDEAHQITHDAFNALLKTLEEPPEHIIFILATTEPQKIPATILSRCQHYRFRLIPFDDIMRQLRKIAAREHIKISSDALQIVAKAAAGSLRDALSILDQVASSAGSEEIQLEDIQYVLGYVPRELMNNFIEALISRDLQAVLAQIASVSEQGYDLYQFANDMREYFRELLIVASGNEPHEESPDVVRYMKTIAKKFRVAEVIRDMRLVARCLDEMRWSEQPRLVLELYAARLCEPFVDLKELAESIETGVMPPSPKPVPLSHPASPSKPAPPSAPANHAAGSTAPVREIPWDSVIEEVEKIKPSLGACLKAGRLNRLSDTEWQLAVSQQFACDLTSRQHDFVEKLIEKKWGKRITLSAVFDNTVPREVTDTPAAPFEREHDDSDREDTATEETIHHPEDDPGVKKVLKVFPGKVII